MERALRINPNNEFVRTIGPLAFALNGQSERALELVEAALAHVRVTSVAPAGRSVTEVQAQSPPSSLVP